MIFPINKKRKRISFCIEKLNNKLDDKEKEKSFNTLINLKVNQFREKKIFKLIYPRIEYPIRNQSYGSRRP